MQEFDLIDKIRSIMGPQAIAPQAIHGIGDDCAVIPLSDQEDLLVSTDILIEGTHFRLATASAEDIGWKAACVNISDIAAMGGEPKYIFLTLGLPDSGYFKEGRSYWVENFTAGFKAACKKYNVVLLGGDISSSREVIVNVTIHGTCPHGAAILRSGARVGDNICVSGTLGDAGLGLYILENSNMPQVISDDERYLTTKHLHPTPRVELAKELARKGIHAMMDISDGVAGDLRHILKASGMLGAVINIESVPLSVEYDSLKEKYGVDDSFALCAGEDYELLFTCDPSMELPQGCTVIGKVTASKELEFIKCGSACLGLDGYKHF